MQDWRHTAVRSECLLRNWTGLHKPNSIVRHSRLFAEFNIRNRQHWYKPTRSTLRRIQPDAGGSCKSALRCRAPPQGPLHIPAAPPASLAWAGREFKIIHSASVSRIKLCYLGSFCGSRLTGSFAALSSAACNKRVCAKAHIRVLDALLHIMSLPDGIYQHSRTCVF